ncbi:wd repeat-containing protein 59-like protein [Dermatophagoides farinae]|uniref:Wd repeat-containing protein 59-like protein n=1 Tax=Dermatophagoides farinae TaxID=6954 RepID=A0A9D4P3J7_DERFA|nr:wd repeat-containing protein 59-like protein [Dermatophagoides farinae]
MVLGWSVANTTISHPDLHAMCLATSGNGKCALVSRRSISIIRTDNLAKIDSVINRETKWDTTHAEFSPPEPKQLAITNAQTINIYNIDESNWLMHTLSGHTRTITDLNWSYKEPTILASSSFDNYIYIWDLRETRKPIYLMHSISGASQIKWSKINENILATSHEGDVRIWDKRKSNMPLHYVSTYLAKITGIDWSPFYENKFLTCSQDGSIKLWDLTNCSKGKSEYHMTTGLPIWKVRYTPFGNGLLTSLVPQMRRTGENNSLWMWKINSLDQPVHSFAGHLDVVLDFGWNMIDSDDYELITWARDNTFRMWKVNPKEFDISSDFDTQSAKFSNLDLSKSSDLSSPMSEKCESNKSEFDNFEDKSDKVFSLKQEFSLFNSNIPNLMIEELNVNKRTCIASLKSSIICRLRIFFPINYPNTIPVFSFLNDTPIQNSHTVKSLDDKTKKEILTDLQSTATFLVQHNRNCLEKCLRQFVHLIEESTSLNLNNVNTIKPQPTVLDILTSHEYVSYLDASVPFPRTSGARFCSSEILVCFGRPPHLEQMNVPTEYTPRSLSALSSYLDNHVRAYNSNHMSVKDNIPSISSFYIDSSKKHRSFRKIHQYQEKKTVNLCGPVMVFSVTKLLPISRQLAEQYLIPSPRGNIISFCEMNAKIAATSGRRDLQQTWNLVRLSAEIYLKNRFISSEELNSHWSRHPFGGKMIQSMIEHYVLKCNDIQTVAMISSVISSCKLSWQEHVPSFVPRKHQPRINYNLSTQDEMSNQLDTEWAIINARGDVTGKNRIRTSSCSSNQEMNINQNKSDKSSTDSNEESNLNERIETTFDSKLVLEYDYYKKIYLDILYRWKLIKKRAQLLKTIESKMLYDDQSHIVSFVNECFTQSCKDRQKLCSNYICSHCNRISLICTICRLPVKGATNHCMKCGHGGHTNHMNDWFQKHEECPSGCGCVCLGKLNIKQWT